MLGLEYSCSFFTWAAMTGQLKIVRGLIGLGPGTGGPHNDAQALQLASSNGHLEVVRELLKNFVYKKRDYLYALIAASESNHTEVIKELLKIRQPSKFTVEDLLKLAKKEGYIGVVADLLKLM